MNMNSKDAAKIIRQAIKSANFKAFVCIQKYCGTDHVCVARHEFKTEFTADQIRLFCKAAKDLGLTFVKGLPIDPQHAAQLTGKTQWDFVNIDRSPSKNHPEFLGHDSEGLATFQGDFGL